MKYGVIHVLCSSYLTLIFVVASNDRDDNHAALTACVESMISSFHHLLAICVEVAGHETTHPHFLAHHHQRSTHST